MKHEVKKVKNGVFITDDLNRRIFVGKIRMKTLTLLKKDNYHYTSASLGVDMNILLSKLLNYSLVQFDFHGRNYTTTRSYFINNGTSRSLFNGRDMMFLPLDKFGIVKALKWEKKFKKSYKDLDQMDVFDVFIEQIKHGMTSNDLFNTWFKRISNE